MAASYEPKRVDLDEETQERIAAVVDQLKDPLRKLVQLVGELADLEFDLSNTPPEVTTNLNLSGDGILIIPLPTDPPLLACMSYHDGHYTSVEVPCRSIPIVVS